MRLLAWGMAERRVAAAGAEFVVAGDAEGYWDLAGDLASGEPYAVYQPPRRVLRTPGLPLAIAASRGLLGDSTTAARGTLAVLASLGPVAVWLLAAELTDRRTALLAGLIAAVTPLHVAFSPLLLSDALFGVALTLQMLKLARGWRLAFPYRLLPIAGAGGMGAVACYLRPAWAPGMAVICVGWLAGRLMQSPRSWRRTAIELTAFVGTFAVVWAPWVIRNARVTGSPVLTTLWTGPTLFDSVGPQADGSSDMTFFDAEAPQRVGWTEAETNAWYLQRSREAIAADPLRIARLAVAKQARFWSPAPSSAEGGPRWLRLPIAAWSLLFFAASAVGLGRADARTRWATALPIATLAAVHLVFVASLRYRMPCELPLCVAAALGAQVLTNALAERRQASRRRTHITLK